MQSLRAEERPERDGHPFPLLRVGLFRQGVLQHHDLSQHQVWLHVLLVVAIQLDRRRVLLERRPQITTGQRLLSLQERRVGITARSG